MAEKRPISLAETAADLPRIEAAISSLAIKKKLRFNENGRRIVVVRRAEKDFFLMLDGHEISSVSDAGEAARFAAELLFL